MNSDDLRTRLGRVGNLISGGKDKPASGPTHSTDRYHRMAAAMGGEIRSSDCGSYCFLRHLYEFGAGIGRAVLDAESAVKTVRHDFFAAGKIQGSSDYGDFLFFDLETTGLGGAGVVPFLIGTGSLTKTGFEVRQYLLPDYPDERAMLEAFAAELGPETTLVSFNGAAFDLPLIKDRFVINRVDRAIEMRHHLDLLHTTRRLFKRRLQDCSLTNVERELFSFHRQGDIPGYLIPSVYFSWLGEDRLDEMGHVLLHNRLDIFSLFFLLDMIVSIFESEGGELHDLADRYSFSRIFSRRKEHFRAAELLDDVDAGVLSSDMLLERGMTLKRAGRLPEAVGLWTEASSDDSRIGYLASVELAKYCEHKLRDYRQALTYAERAARICPYGLSERNRLRGRLTRLRQKQQGC